ncbi:unnamed protein product [Dovyalis caffra]|uniref:DDE Tnp4 domain-containing protein n=1 Tax=Dovyalis caffra TaxID=77055 RepID=A0AAV1QYS7_9ROSI|nr:unnamed protein product [Dovyalis caffra]
MDTQGYAVPRKDLTKTLMATDIHAIFSDKSYPISPFLLGFSALSPNKSVH